MSHWTNHLYSNSLQYSYLKKIEVLYHLKMFSTLEKLFCFIINLNLFKKKNQKHKNKDTHLCLRKNERDDLGPGSWRSLRIMSKIVNGLNVSWLKTLTKLKCCQKCIEKNLLITNFSHHYMINNHLMPEWKFDLSLILLHDPDA